MFGLLPEGWAHPLCTRGAWACLRAGHIPMHTWRLGSCLSCGHTLRTYGAALLPQCWARSLHTHDAWAPASVLETPMHTHGAWAVCLRAGHTPAHMWRLGTPRPNYPWPPYASEPKIALNYWLCRGQNRLGLCMNRTQIALDPAIIMI